MISRPAADAPGTAVAAVSFDHVSKRFGDFVALSDVCLEANNGECLVVCGPSGSGKSTLIRCVNRLETHDAGKIRVGEIEVSEATTLEVRRATGMVFQQFNLFPHMSVLENCTLAQRIVMKRTEPEARRVALQHLEGVRIAEQANKFPGQLSGGQQQRAAIARCLAMDPKILLLDEPTSALDPEMVHEVLEILVSLAREGRTMICVTHEMGFAREVASRVAFMDQGRVLEVAAPQEFFTRPKTERAAQFLGQLLR